MRKKYSKRRTKIHAKKYFEINSENNESVCVCVTWNSSRISSKILSAFAASLKYSHWTTTQLLIPTESRLKNSTSLINQSPVAKKINKRKKNVVNLFLIKWVVNHGMWDFVEEKKIIIRKKSLVHFLLRIKY